MKFVVESHSIGVAPMYHVTGTLTRDGFVFDADSARAPLALVGGQPSWAGCEVRVRAKFRQSEKAMLEFARAHVLAEFADAKRLDLELVAVPDGGLRAPEVAAAKTLADKLAAWATEVKVVLPAHVLEALAAL
jgi:hypothetical protein